MCNVDIQVHTVGEGGELDREMRSLGRGPGRGGRHQAQATPVVPRPLPQSRRRSASGRAKTPQADLEPLAWGGGGQGSRGRPGQACVPHLVDGRCEQPRRLGELGRPAGSRSLSRNPCFFFLATPGCGVRCVSGSCPLRRPKPAPVPPGGGETERGAQGGRRSASPSLGARLSREEEGQREPGPGSEISGLAAAARDTTERRRRRGGCDGKVSGVQRGRRRWRRAGGRSSEELQVLLRLHRRNSGADGALRALGWRR